MGFGERISHALGVGKPKVAPLAQAAPRKLKRTYQGAIISRLTADWLATQTSADAEIRTSLRKLRDRSREMVRNNPYAKQAKRTTQINVVGTGVALQAQVMLLRGNRPGGRKVSSRCRKKMFLRCR